MPRGRRSNYNNYYPQRSLAVGKRNKYSIYSPMSFVKYSNDGPKNIIRVGNIIHRVERKRSLWIGTTRMYFLLIKAFSFHMSRYGFFLLYGTQPPPLVVFIRNL